jgi:hypothetical protein
MKTAFPRVVTLLLLVPIMIVDPALVTACYTGIATPPACIPFECQALAPPTGQTVRPILMKLHIARVRIRQLWREFVNLPDGRKARYKIVQIVENQLGQDLLDYVLILGTIGLTLSLRISRLAAKVAGFVAAYNSVDIFLAAAMLTFLYRISLHSERSPRYRLAQLLTILPIPGVYVLHRVWHPSLYFFIPLSIGAFLLTSLFVFNVLVTNYADNARQQINQGRLEEPLDVQTAVAKRMVILRESHAALLWLLFLRSAMSDLSTNIPEQGSFLPFIFAYRAALDEEISHRLGLDEPVTPRRWMQRWPSLVREELQTWLWRLRMWRSGKLIPPGLWTLGVAPRIPSRERALQELARHDDSETLLVWDPTKPPGRDWESLPVWFVRNAVLKKEAPRIQPFFVNEEVHFRWTYEDGTDDTNSTAPKPDDHLRPGKLSDGPHGPAKERHSLLSAV